MAWSDDVIFTFAYHQEVQCHKMTNVWQKESKLHDQNFSLATASKERSLGPWTLCPVILAACPTFRDQKRHSGTVWIRLLLLDSLEQLQQKKENTELINADRKPYKNDNLKYNKWLRKRAKITGKTILTRSVRQLRIQLSDWFTWTKNKTLY